MPESLRLQAGCHKAGRCLPAVENDHALWREPDAQHVARHGASLGNVARPVDMDEIIFAIGYSGISRGRLVVVVRNHDIALEHFNAIKQGRKLLPVRVGPFLRLLDRDE